MLLNAYLIFDGDCRAAFEFYRRCLGGEIVAMHTYGEAPAEEAMPAAVRDKIMHARLVVDGQVLMGSDNTPECPVPYEGIKGVSLTLGVDTPEEAERRFDALADNGTLRMPLQETFWAERFGMLVDRFGVAWMINCEKEAPPS
ncbi:VOC family protein [Bisbaumannia pacifica]|uniref:Glyoxalase/bleomycin resistance/extradiol dioxygenase family protein n=1 Tax=Bisbaumannia pacifica TaxID=77098 RepID=A0ABD4KZ98_9GAMM|nr:glyoxalase/bleomycin resistance/extradiol dioxygenase family protein [Halomonas pacifica]MBH8579767.1 glyoxalase/bleomycin resistance/extradiol dioxygenase family protein [Halomonas pacifica]